MSTADTSLQTDYHRVLHVAEPIIAELGRDCIAHDPSEHVVLVEQEPHGCVSAIRVPRSAILSRAGFEPLREYVRAPPNPGTLYVVLVARTGTGAFATACMERPLATFASPRDWN